MKKRISALILLAALCSCAFSGCGGQTETGGGGTASSGTVSQRASSAAASPAESQGEAPADSIGYELPIVDPGSVTLKLAVPENGYAPASYANNLAIFQEFESRTGVLIEWQVYPGSEFNQAMTTRLASGTDLPDMFKVPAEGDNTPTLVRLANDGTVLPIDGLIAQYGPNITALYNKYPDMRNGTTLDDGHIYSLPYSYYEQRTLKVPVVTVRKDWLDKLGLSVPETIGDWETVLKAFKEQDPNGNGTADEVPLTTEQLQSIDGGGLGVFANAWGLRYGASSMGKMLNADGKVAFAQLKPEFKEFLTWMNGLYRDGLLHPDAVLKNDSQTFNQLVSNDTLGASVRMVGSIPTWNATVKTGSGSEAEYIPVLPPKLDASGTQYNEIQNGILFHFAVSKDCKTPDVAVKWLDYFYASDEGRRLAHWGLEGENYTLENGKPVFTELVTDNPDGLDILSVQRSYGCFNNFLMFRDIEFMKAVSKPVEVEFSEKNKQNFVEPFPTLVPTADEARRLASIMADIDPYQEEMVTKFIMGIESLDNFDAFVDTMKSLGIDEAIALWQAQYDRIAK